MFFNNAEIDYTALLGIARGFRGELVATFTAAETSALLDFLKRGNRLTVRNFDFDARHKVLRSTHDLAHTFKFINSSIDLLHVDQFKRYF